MKMKPETRRRLEIFADIVYTLVLGFPLAIFLLNPEKNILWITFCGFGAIFMMPIGVKHSLVHHKMKPETKIYRPKNPKILLLVLASGAAMVGGIFILIPRAPLQGWLFTAFFGFCFLVFLIRLMPGSTELKLTEKSFVMTTLFFKNSTKWTDVKSFHVVDGFDFFPRSQNKNIKFNYAKNHKTSAKTKLLKSLAKQMTGYHGTFPHTYGVKATELLKTLREWKKKYGAQ